jgi:hypothetical protein
MTDNAVSTIERSAPMRVTGRLKQALDAMIWRGLARDEAALAAGLKPHSLYCAFRKRHVLAYFAQELGSLRASAKAKAFHVLESIAASSENDMARVNAVKAMAQLDVEEIQHPRQPTSPGFVVVVGDARVLVGQQPPAPPAVPLTIGITSTDRAKLPRRFPGDDEAPTE